MKKFIIRFLLFTLVFIMVIIIGYQLPDTATHQNMYYSIYDKHELLEKTKSNRLILVGGSGTSFGFYSPDIESAFNMNVINTAIVGGTGLKFILDDTYQFIKEGDIVILSPEYEHFFNRKSFYGGEPLIQLMDAYPDAKKLFSFRQWYANLWNLCKVSLLKSKNYVWSPFTNDIDKEITPFERRSFNDNGDIITHWDLTGGPIKTETLKESFDNNALDYILKFQQKIEAKGAHLYINYCSLNRTSFNTNLEKIKEVEQRFNQENLKLLGTPEKYSFADSLYFDGPYHLAKEGQLLRTQLLIEDLKKITSH